MTTFVNNDVASGNVIFASDHNEQGARLAAILNGGIDNNNIGSTAAIDGSKLDGGNSGMFGSWVSYTPTWTNLTTGNGTLNHAKYIQIGKTVIVRFKFTLGSTSSASDTVKISLPVDAVDYGSIFQALGRGVFWDNSASTFFPMDVVTDTTSTVAFGMNNVSSTYAAWNYLDDTVPAAPASSDYIQAQFIYEAA